MIVEVIGGAEQRPEVRVVDVDELSRVVLALGEVTDAEADEALRAAGLGRLDGDTASIEVDALRAAAQDSVTSEDWPGRWEEFLAAAPRTADDGPLRVEVQSAAGA